MTRIFNARSEGNGLGFKIMFPTRESLLAMINSNPTSREEAQYNKGIRDQIKTLGYKDE